MKKSVKEYIEHIGNNPKTGKPYSRIWIYEQIKRGILKHEIKYGKIIIIL